MYEPVIGLEIHLALKTATKLFCACRADAFGAPPNTHTCPVCLGLPGSLPVANREAIDKALLFSLALRCTVPEKSGFHRKNYFYPDAPKNYQISQYDFPLGAGGYLELDGGLDGEEEGGEPKRRRIGIARCHLEEDAGRLVHPAYTDYSLVDLNRAGAPLVEMVTEPDLRSPDEARDFLVKVRAIAQALGVSDANPEEGKMRADVNVSVRRPGEGFGTKVEVKNLNSFRNVQRALEFEIRRQSRLLGEGGRVTQSTLGWDEGGQKTYLMRTKEGEADYRYFPDPDLPPLRLGRDWLARLQGTMPELPEAKRARYLALGVRGYDAALIAGDVELAGFFDAALGHFGGDPQTLANWLNGDVLGWLNAQGLRIGASGLTPLALARLVGLVAEGAISGRAAKSILPEVMGGADPDALVAARGLGQLSDASEVERLVDEVLAAHPELAADARLNPKAVNALLGRVMRSSGGTAKPELVREFLVRKLEAASSA